MQTKPLLYGLIGFFMGGALVAIAATTFDKPEADSKSADSSMQTSMADMTDSLEGKTGEAFDKAFLSGMIVHHKGAVAMAKAAQRDAQHDEIKQLADDIIAAQNKEISQMILWQTQWGYADGSKESMVH